MGGGQGHGASSFADTLSFRDARQSVFAAQCGALPLRLWKRAGVGATSGVHPTDFVGRTLRASFARLQAREGDKSVAAIQCELESLYSDRLTAIGLVCWRGGALRCPLAV
jgi:hypothetical protein